MHNKKKSRSQMPRDACTLDVFSLFFLNHMRNNQTQASEKENH